jgi:CubicO group peptidase (beta-lactamase class C family)
MKDPRARTITVRQLLSHVAGMPDVTDYRWNHPEYDPGSLERYVRGLKDSTLIAAPGAAWRYSNIGFEVLADLIAKVTGQAFEDVVQQRILAPLRMTKSTLLMTDIDSTLMAYGHDPDSTGQFHRNADYPYNRRHAASSTLHANVSDMLRWARANLHRGTLDGARILPDSAYDELWKPGHDITPFIMALANEAGVAMPYSTYGIGLSWFLPVGNGHRLVNHGGSDHGFRSDILLAPDDSVGIVVMMNGGTKEAGALSWALMEIALGAIGRR